MYDLQREKREAFDAGNRALNSLRKAQHELKSAGNWGLFDILGGGTITTFVKHSKMNHAQEYMAQAKYDLAVFSRELQDVGRYIDLDMNTGDFLSFADYFWDGFVADVMVQSRISQAKKQVEQAIRYVERALAQLR